MTKQCMMSKKLIGSTERKDEISLPVEKRVRKNRFSITQLAYTERMANASERHADEQSAGGLVRRASASRQAGQQAAENSSEKSRGRPLATAFSSLRVLFQS